MSLKFQKQQLSHSFSPFSSVSLIVSRPPSVPSTFFLLALSLSHLLKLHSDMQYHTSRQITAWSASWLVQHRAVFPLLSTLLSALPASAKTITLPPSNLHTVFSLSFLTKIVIPSSSLFTLLDLWPPFFVFYWSFLLTQLSSPSPSPTPPLSLLPFYFLFYFSVTKCC